MALRRKKRTEWLGKVRGGRGYMGPLRVPKPIISLILNVAKIIANHWENPEAQLHYLRILLKNIPQEVVDAVDKNNEEI
jgi:hypothetical protein